MKQLIFILLLVFIAGCEKETLLKSTPSCVHEIINEILEEETWDPPAQVYSYDYKGAKVYYIPPRCCDFFSVLYDENCNVICAPDGGISGMGDGNCSNDFFTLATNKTLIWEDTREK